MLVALIPIIEVLSLLKLGLMVHGDPGVNLAGHIQIAESWAEHMALTMVKQAYPASLGRITSQRIGNSWVEHHEMIRNESRDHVPIGVYLDLVDGLTSRESVQDEDLRNSGFIVDGVNRSFSNGFLARKMDESIRSPGDLRNMCLNNLPSTTSKASVNLLFDQY